MKDLSATKRVIELVKCVLSGLEKLAFAKGDSQIGSGTSVNWEDLVFWEQEFIMTE